MTLLTDIHDISKYQVLEYGVKYGSNIKRLKNFLYTVTYWLDEKSNFWLLQIFSLNDIQAKTIVVTGKLGSVNS